MIKKNSLKRVLKHGMNFIAAKYGPHTRLPREPQLLILMYHRVLPNDDERRQLEEPGMFVSPETLKSNIITISQYFDIIRLSDWIDHKARGIPLPDKACAITFDDGWSDNFEYAFPILKDLNVPATIFLVADMIGTNEVFWPERLARITRTIAVEQPALWLDPSLDWLRTCQTDYKFSDTPPTQEELSQLIFNAKQYNDQELKTRLSELESLLGLETNNYDPALLNWDQVNEMIKSGLVDMGSHTCRHIRLNNNTPNKLLVDEISNSKTIIEEHTGSPVQSFCFPNGDFTSEALNYVRNQYDWAVSTKFGWNSLKTDIHLLQRIGIHEDVANTKNSFLARISTWI